MNLGLKQRQFNAAMALYEGRSRYGRVQTAVAVAVLLGQAALAWRALGVPVGWAWGLGAFAAAYLATDFLNGLVHLFMDHNEAYASPVGPFIAAFHLHHRTPRYQDRPLWAVYFHESGFKFWLPAYLLAALALSARPGLPGPLLHGLAWVGVLSSVAEVSHYLCHNSSSRLARALARTGLLLGKRAHARHHREDNVGYAFLNGWTNPLIDRIARCCFPGYKAGTDRHFATWEPGSPDFHR